jgi:hypothetical protein
LDINKRSPLHYAATLGDQGAIYKILIQSGADPNIKDVDGNTPGIYLRRKDLLTRDQLLELNNAPTDEAENNKQSTQIDTWERPPSPQEALQNIQQNGKIPSKISSSSAFTSVAPMEIELSPHQLQQLEHFYNQITTKESSWVQRWRKLTRKNNANSAKIYLEKYLPPELFELLKIRMTPRFGATLLDCIKFYPQFFLIAPDPRSYFVFRELFLGSMRGVNGLEVAKESLFLKKPENFDIFDSIPNVDIAAKFIKQVRLRLSRNFCPFPFVSFLNKEGLAEVSRVVDGVIKNELEKDDAVWERVDWERVVNDVELREELIGDKDGGGGRGVVAMDATKLSRFWPHHRHVYLSPPSTEGSSNQIQIWVNGQDHLDFIVVGKYGQFSSLLKELGVIYSKLKSFDYHWNSEVGFLTVDPFRAGMGLKVKIAKLQSQLSMCKIIKL